MKILFVAPYPHGRSPSQRFRFEQYLDLLSSSGHQWQLSSFLSESGWDTIYAKGRPISKFLAIIAGFARRWVLMLRVPQYDVVFIHREAAPIGPPLFEWIISRLFRKPIIYDFDDAIWLTDRRTELTIARIARWRRKVSWLCRVSKVVSCGNEYLCSYARGFNKNVVLNPTTIDTRYHDESKRTGRDGQIRLGWTGSHSTLKYIDEVVPVIQRLQSEFPNLVFTVIADVNPKIPLPRFKFIRWSESTEITDLGTIDIGIMPLPDDPWTRGKCGFKALQYMAMGIPTVASPVGVNSTIIQHGSNGFLCQSAVEWHDVIVRLLKNEVLRNTVGRAGKETVRTIYSVTANSPTFLSLFTLSATATRART